MPKFLSKRVLANRDCCLPYFQRQRIGVAPDPDPPSPPLTSLYCVQWSINDTNLFFPCAEGSDVNGNTDTSGGLGSICGSNFAIADFNGVLGNTFNYDNYNGMKWYAQVIRLAVNPVLADLGYYAYDVFGTPVSLPIPATNSNCTPHCYAATFDVEDVSTDGLYQLYIQDTNRAIEEVGIGLVDPFDTPDVAAEYLAHNVNAGGLEADATIQVIINSPTNVTLIICSIMVIYSGSYGNATTFLGNFNFTEI